MRVLVIASARTLAQIVSRFIRETDPGIDVETAPDVASAAHLAHPFDVIFVCGRLADPPTAWIGPLRATSPTARVVVAASLGDRDRLRALRTAGIDGIVRRPFVRSEIEAAIAAARHSPP